MVEHRVGSDPVATGRRIEPSVTVAVVAVLAYMAVVNTIQATSGIPYTEWFSSAGNVVRTVVIPLAVANVVLLAVLCVVALVRSLRADREFTGTPQGLAPART